MLNIFKKTNKVHPQNSKKELQPIQRHVDAEEIKEIWKTEDGKYLFTHYHKFNKIYTELQSKYNFNPDGNIIDNDGEQLPYKQNQYPVKLGTLAPQLQKEISDTIPLKTQIDKLFKENKDKKDKNKQQLISIREYYRDGGNMVPKKDFKNQNTEIVVDLMDGNSINDKKSSIWDYVIKIHGIPGYCNELKDETKYFSKELIYPTWDALHGILDNYAKSVQNKKLHPKDKQLNITLQSCYQDLSFTHIKQDIQACDTRIKEYNDQLEDGFTTDSEGCNIQCNRDLEISALQNLQQSLKTNEEKRDAFLTKCAKVPNLEVTINYDNIPRRRCRVNNLPIPYGESFQQMKINTVYNKQCKKWVAEYNFSSKNISDIINCHGAKSEPFALTKEKSFVENLKKIFNNNPVRSK